MQPISVSLVIPTYNRADLIAETIASALNQLVPFSEIIVVDDGSTDNTAQVLAPFGDRIKLIRLVNGGVQAARNAGVAAASGDYITLCDSDDLLASAFVEKTAGWLEQHPETDAVFCNFATFDELGTHPDKFSLAPPGFFDGAVRHGEFVAEIPDLYLRTVGYQPLFMSGVLIKKQFYTSLGGFDTAFNNIGAEDWEFTLRAIASGKTALCTTVLTKIRRHAGNDSSNAARMVLGTVHILEHALRVHPIAAQYQEAIRDSIDERRRLVFQDAFARADFTLAQDMLARLPKTGADTKFRLKALIMKLPSALRRRAWQMTQA